MRIPRTPPQLSAILGLSLMDVEEGMAAQLDLLKSRIDRLQTIYEAQIGMEPGGAYRHWDILRHLVPPDGLTPEEWWLGVKLARRSNYKPLLLRAKDDSYFQYVSTDSMQKMLHEIDKNASGTIKGNELVGNPQTRDSYIFKTLMEESITSSQLEGATTTHKVAKDMIRSGRKPRDHSEKMIYNNYMAMLFIREIRDRPLTPSIICELHSIVTENTLRDGSAAGRVRRDDEPIQVEDAVGNVLHIPPSASELSERMQQMCDFANGAATKGFMHPVVRAIFLHFWLAYDHPFVDGNGRTARALFYWAMANQGYWLCEFISISRIIKKAPVKYAESFLYTENDENDATYFILGQLRVIVRAIKDLHTYLHRKQQELYDTRQSLNESKWLKDKLNYRQLALLNHAMKNPYYGYAVDSHRKYHNVSYETSRKDLLDLAKYKLLEMSKIGHAFRFSAPPDLQDRIHRLSTQKKPNVM